ncbi:MAG: ATP-dependent Clp protease proteolytic subunit [Bdellovibrionota bacterium]
MNNLFSNDKDIIYLFDAIDENVSHQIIKEIIIKSQISNNIFLFINSPGGSVIDALAIYDIIQYYKDKITTVGLGVVGSIATLLLSSASFKKRYLFNNTTIHIHLPFGVTEIEESKSNEVIMEELRLVELATGLFTKHTNSKLNLDRLGKQENLIFNAYDAVNNYGLADHII